MTAVARLLLLSLALSACSGSFFKTKTPPLRMYQLSAARAAADAAPAVVPNAIAVNLAVLKPRLRAGLDTDRIAALYPDRRLEYFADVRWSGPLDEVLQDLAVQEFRSANLRNVTADASVFASAYWLEIEVVDFQAEYSASATAPTVHVHFVARIGNSTERRILARLEASAQEGATDDRMSAIVDAYNRAADKAFAEIVVATAAALQKPL